MIDEEYVNYLIQGINELNELLAAADARNEALAAERGSMTELIKAVGRFETLIRSQLRTADFHSAQCKCIRCAEDDILAAFAALKGETT